MSAAEMDLEGRLAGREPARPDIIARSDRSLYDALAMAGSGSEAGTAVRALAAECAADLAALAEQEREIRVQWAQRVKVLNAFNVILLDLGEKEVPVPRPTFEMGSAFETLPLSNGTSKAIRATRMPFARGNQSESMPPRQERFADSRLEDAIADVLTQAQGPTKVEGVIRAIYVIHTTEGFHAATETINSSLSKGARAGRWKRVGRGLYEI